MSVNSHVQARKDEMLRYLAVGLIPIELGRDAMLMCEERPPWWQVFKRRRYDAAVDRLMRFAGLRR